MRLNDGSVPITSLHLRCVTSVALGKSAIHLARTYGERTRNFAGQHFWARGYFVSTVGRDEAVIREYIRKQEEETSGWIR